MQKKYFYFTNLNKIDDYINRWDILLLILMFLIVFFLWWAKCEMTMPYHIGSELSIDLSPYKLPIYAMQTTLRLFIALVFSIIFTFIIGALAAKNQLAEKIIIPSIDILQSVPVLSFLAITTTGFLHLFPNTLLGPECAAIFAIFTAQVWNIIFGFYQSLKSVPNDLQEVAKMLQLSAWQKFWHIEVPFSMSSLLWNIMISVSASWFFVVLSESIVIAHQKILLPGIGSYIAVAIAQRNIYAIIYAIIMMIFVIVIYNQLLFRPLIAWSEKFKCTDDADQYQSWLIDLVRKSYFMKKLGMYLGILINYFINISWLRNFASMNLYKTKINPRLLQWLWNIGLFCLLCTAALLLTEFFIKNFDFHVIIHVLFLGMITGIRVIVLILFSSLLWIPVGVWIGLRPRITQKIQPLIQCIAAFPVNLFYPLVVIGIVNWHLNLEIWMTPMMILGTQWYILFNVIAGASSIPRELYLVAENFGLNKWLWWKRLILPGIFPFYITGAITAAGGAWNASIVAEWMNWGNTTLKATGLGAYIQEKTIDGDFVHIALGTIIMCLYVLIFNYVIWRPLYRLADKRFT